MRPVLLHLSVDGLRDMRTDNRVDNVAQNALRLERYVSVLQPLHHVGQQAGLHLAEPIVKWFQPRPSLLLADPSCSHSAFVAQAHLVLANTLPAVVGNRDPVTGSEATDPSSLKIHCNPADGELGVVPPARELGRHLLRVAELRHQQRTGDVVDKVEHRMLVPHEGVVVVEADHLGHAEVDIRVGVYPVLQADLCARGLGLPEKQVPFQSQLVEALLRAFEDGVDAGVAAMPR
mmetsp:Transcript_30845/g.88069  ORF Transcript_30845/g.88069 Transcript_30845/m.88069 type:complete len:233 (-) Transcript_30845:23-721(-)